MSLTEVETMLNKLKNKVLSGEKITVEEAEWLAGEADKEELYEAASGIILGLILCFIQQKFGIISLGGGGGTFVVDAYPVSVHAWDVVLVFVTVLAVGFLSVWYPVRYLSKRLL